MYPSAARSPVVPDSQVANRTALDSPRSGRRRCGIPPAVPDRLSSFQGAFAEIGILHFAVGLYGTGRSISAEIKTARMRNDFMLFVLLFFDDARIRRPFPAAAPRCGPGGPAHSPAGGFPRLRRVGQEMKDLFRQVLRVSPGDDLLSDLVGPGQLGWSSVRYNPPLMGISKSRPFRQNVSVWPRRRRSPG